MRWKALALGFRMAHRWLRGSKDGSNRARSKTGAHFSLSDLPAARIESTKIACSRRIFVVRDQRNTHLMARRRAVTRLRPVDALG